MALEASRATSASSSAHQNGGGASGRPSPPVSYEYSERKEGGEEQPTGTVTAGSLPHNPEQDNLEQPSTGILNTLRERWSETITHEEASIPLAWQALLTGLVDALIYGRSAIWTGFQTGEHGGQFGPAVDSPPAPI